MRLMKIWVCVPDGGWGESALFAQQVIEHLCLMNCIEIKDRERVSLTKNVRGTFEERHPKHGSLRRDTCTGVTELPRENRGAASLPRAVSSSMGHFFGKVLLLFCYCMLACCSLRIFLYIYIVLSVVYLSRCHVARSIPVIL